MDFFKQLHEISDGLDITMRIKAKNGKLTISVLPDNIDKVQPLITTGTPEHLDAEFIEAIRKPLADTKLAIANLQEYEQSVKDAVDKGAQKANPAPATNKKTATSKPPVKINEEKEKQEGEASDENDNDQELQEIKDAEKIAETEGTKEPKKKPAKTKENKPKEPKKKPEGPVQLTIG